MGIPVLAAEPANMAAVEKRPAALVSINFQTCFCPPQDRNRQQALAELKLWGAKVPVPATRAPVEAGLVGSPPVFTALSPVSNTKSKSMTLADSQTEKHLL